MSSIDRTSSGEAAIAIKPEAYIYLNRTLSRPKTDLSGRRADIDAALQKDPDMTDAVAAKADMQTEAKDFDGAVATYSKAIGANPKDIRILAKRGITYVQAGKPTLASTDFEQAKALASNASDLNEICWVKAQAGVALESALSECDAALAKEPGAPAVLDSRGLVLLRLNRPADAIAAYTGVLAKWPREANSLFGRALARFRAGDVQGARQDRQAALAVDPDVAKTYSEMGMEDLPANQM